MMKKVFLVAIATTSMALIDDNLTVYGKVSSTGSHFGAEYLSESEHRLGEYHWKYGVVCGLDLGFSSDNFSYEFVGGVRTEIGDNHALVAGLGTVFNSRCVDNSGYIIYSYKDWDDEIVYVEAGDKYKEMPDTVDRIYIAYQRRLSANSNNWIEASIELHKHFAETEIVGSLGLKKFLISYND